MYREVEPREEGGTKRIVTVLAAVFLVALAVVVGTRMSSDAIGVLVGVIAGVAASIPTALLLIVVTRRRDTEPEPDYYEERRQPVPSIIVVTPGSAPQVVPQYPGAYTQQQLPAVQGARRFRVMGLDEEDAEPLEGESTGGAWYQ